MSVRNRNRKPSAKRRAKEAPAEQPPVIIGGVSVQPGEVAHLELTVARLPTHTKLTIPIIVRHGRVAGPRVWLSAAVHGDELNGIEIIHRVLDALRDEPQDEGTILAVPIVNVFGFIHQSRYLPDGRDLNRSFPGSHSGSLAARTARLFMEEVVANCTHGIDLHTGSGHRTNLPQVRANLDEPETAEFASSFGAPVTLHSKERDHSLRDVTSRESKPVLLYEGGEALRFDEDAIQTGADGVLRTLRFLGLTSLDRGPARPTCIMRRSRWLRAKRGGILRLSVSLGDEIARGEQIGTIGDPFGGDRAVVKAAVAGIVIGRAQNPVVYQGDAVVHIATG